MKLLACAALVAAAPLAALAQNPMMAQPKTKPIGTIAMPGKQQMPEDKSKRPSPPAVAKADVRGTEVIIDYSRPSLKGRAAFGDKSELAPTGQVWRTGANEATTFTVSKAVKIDGQPLAAGTYALFTIPGPTEWTIIFNKTAQQWGAFKYDAGQDALRVKVKPQPLTAPVEQFTIRVGSTGEVSMDWGRTEVNFRVM